VGRKLRFALVLPIVQVAITAVLGVWADRVDWILLSNTSRAPGSFVHLDLAIIEGRLIWRGINAPTYPLCLAGSSNRQLLGFGVDEILYLAAVVLLWYWVGRFFDRRRGVEATSDGIKKVKPVYYFFLLAWGNFLLLVSLWNVSTEVSFARSYFFRVDAFVVAAMYLAWSLILLTLAGRRLARGIPREHAKSDIAA
jgi:hypothetical protein